MRRTRGRAVNHFQATRLFALRSETICFARPSPLVRPTAAGFNLKGTHKSRCRAQWMAVASKKHAGGSRQTAAHQTDVLVQELSRYRRLGLGTWLLPTAFMIADDVSIFTIIPAANKAELLLAAFKKSNEPNEMAIKKRLIWVTFMHIAARTPWIQTAEWHVT